MYLVKISKNTYNGGSTNTNNMYKTSSTDGVIKSQTMSFRDGTQQWVAELPQGYDATREVALNDDATLSSFFERPVFTAAYSWAPGDPVFYKTFDPWNVFFTGSRVVNRISNFNLMTAKLCVKFLINGNPFYYGRIMCDYQVLPTLDVMSDVSSGSAQLIPASQRLKLYIDPCTSEGGTLCLPFIYGKDTLSVPDAAWTDLGRIYMREVVALKHANASTSPLEITVSIWAEDVKLSVPTTRNAGGIVNQAGDEYGDRTISSMATNMASTMNMARDVPVIGPYAKATSTVFNAMGAAAKLFGFSRPAIIQDATQIRPMLIGPMANTDRGDSVTKLTLDSKQELTIDPATFGVAAKDELTISNLVTKESYVEKFAWNITDAPGALLRNYRVTPNICVTSAAPAVYLPACAFAAVPFKYWRGTVKYRFQIVASAYHRGRLRFVYDPGFVANLDANVAFTKVVDLENERDFTIEVSWASNKHYLTSSSFLSLVNYASSTAFASTSLFGNGVLAVYVLNTLTAPNSVANNDISINMSISMCDDAEFAVLDESPLDLITYSPSAAAAFNTSIVNQSGNEVGEEDSSNAPVIDETDDSVQHCLPLDHTNDVYFGEHISSFRQLLKRYNYLTTYKNVATGTQVWVNNAQDFPAYRGEYSTAPTVTGTAIAYNYVRTTLLNYLAPAFVGYRGSMRTKYLYYSDTGPLKGYGFVSRKNTYAAPGTAGGTITNTTASTLAASYTNIMFPGLNGMMATSLDQQPVLEVEFPYYLPYRFDSTRGPLLNTSGGGNSSHGLHTTINSTVSGVHRYISVGEDFQLFLYQGPPPIYLRTTPAA